MRLLIAVIAGLITATGFAPIGWWPLTLLGVAGFTMIVWKESGWRGARLGYAYGLGFTGLGVGWVYVLGIWAAVGLVVVLSLWWALLGSYVSVVTRYRWWPLTVAAGWVAMEWASARFPFGGFAWNRLAWITVDSPMSGALAWIGAAGTTALAALMANLVVAIIKNPDSFRVHLSTLIAIIAVSAIATVSLPRYESGEPDAETPQSGKSVTVGMVQGDLDGTAGLNALGPARSVTQNHLSETINLTAKSQVGLEPAPDIIVWPENSTDADPTQDPQTRAMVEAAIDAAGVPILVGAIMNGPGEGERQTSSLWWTTDNEIIARYDKKNIVPFGEWIPFRDQLVPLVPTLNRVGRQSVAGTGSNVLQGTVKSGQPLRVGELICFEVAFDQTIQSMAGENPDIMVLQSSNGTFTGTGQPYQQFAITRARAIEMRRNIVVSTTASLSGYVHPDGTVTDPTKESTAASHAWSVPYQDTVSIALMTGPLVEYAALLTILVTLGAAFRASRQARTDALGGSAPRVSSHGESGDDGETGTDQLLTAGASESVSQPNESNIEADGRPGGHIAVGTAIS